MNTILYAMTITYLELIIDLILVYFLFGSLSKFFNPRRQFAPASEQRVHAVFEEIWLAVSYYHNVWLVRASVNQKKYNEELFILTRVTEDCLTPVILATPFKIVSVRATYLFVGWELPK